MNVVACAAPVGSIEAAPMTSLPVLTGDESAKLDAFWAADDSYYVRAQGEQGVRWFRMEVEMPEVEQADEARRAAVGLLMADIIPLGGGKIAFPVGSTGRTVFRVWRSRGVSERPARTRILAVRAARSRRLPA